MSSPADRAALRAAEVRRQFRGIDAHHVAAAMNLALPGTHWGGCSKGNIAEQFVNAALYPSEASHPRLAQVDVQQVARRARARAAGELRWALLP